MNVKVDEEIDRIAVSISRMEKGGDFLGYISHIVFPRFKGLERGARIDFDFPVTALVGANGIGKSSVLHALWGAPFGYSTSKFWFATELDPIEGQARDTQRYFYGHWNDAAGRFVETRKARLGSRRTDYWEPYRTSTADGMAPLPAGDFPGKSKDRWNPVRRDCVYINLKAIFGSFDRYFYFEDETGSSERREAMLREASRLKQIADTERQSYRLGGGRERLFENRMLTDEELSHVSSILGREYVSARVIRHSLYPRNRGEDLSVIFQSSKTYSEAYAGSGEISVVAAVIKILSANRGSLILLDEPETSLHPGAQRMMLRFLLQQSRLNRHQIILSTHSMEFLKGLPSSAVKVFENTGAGGTRVLQGCSPSAALWRLGRPPEQKLRVLVEDDIASIVTERAARMLDAGDYETLDIRIAPGGADAILSHLAPSALASADDLRVLLDGDKKKVEMFTDPQAVAPADLESLDERVLAESGVRPALHIPGGRDTAGHKQAKQVALLSYLSWMRQGLAYLPKPTPEHIIIDSIRGLGASAELSAAQAKEQLRILLYDGADLRLGAEEYRGLVKLAVARIGDDNADLQIILRQLQSWLV
ncbi:ATP-dependent nuclease [Stenotrophomonas indicatrix]|uniref:ATP-dependent nuclease n=1 Tax=Stenotrophomonas indicatrix TaxID=2045451 RepID=UPI00289BCB45|nr:AAA family ATPase [Stenotrophomonas indicatrix]